MRASRSVALNPFRQLRSVCEFWADERKYVACCQFADEESLEFEGESFDCETCAVATHLASLDADNRRAWDLSQTLLTRLVADTHAFGPLLVQLAGNVDADEFEALLRRITLIYDVLVPAPSAPRSE